MTECQSEIETVVLTPEYIRSLHEDTSSAGQPTEPECSAADDARPGRSEPAAEDAPDKP